MANSWNHCRELKGKGGPVTKLLRSAKLVFGSMFIYAVVVTSHGCGATGPLFGSGSNGTGGHGGSVGPGTPGQTSAKSSGSVMNPVPKALAESGSRLRAQWYTGSDGSKQFYGFFDSMLQTECTFFRMSDGLIHCAPVGATLISSLFSDAGCSLPAALSASCLPATAKYAASFSGCPSSIHVYAVTPAPQLYAKSGAQCVPYVPQMGNTGYAIGAELPPSAFVSANIVTD
jgi:hypothetical protein